MFHSWNCSIKLKVLVGLPVSLKFSRLQRPLSLEKNATSEGGLSCIPFCLWGTEVLVWRHISNKFSPFPKYHLLTAPPQTSRNVPNQSWQPLALELNLIESQFEQNPVSKTPVAKRVPFHNFHPEWSYLDGREGGRKTLTLNKGVFLSFSLLNNSQLALLPIL